MSAISVKGISRLTLYLHISLKADTRMCFILSQEMLYNFKCYSFNVPLCLFFVENLDFSEFQKEGLWNENTALRPFKGLFNDNNEKRGFVRGIW